MKKIKKALAQYWGYETFLPLQKQAMECVNNGVDSVVVLPTGGGKSLCFQAPAVTMPGLALVVSPLISLMKDQVDSLKECGVAAERIDSSLTPSEQSDVFNSIRSGELKLLYLSPERLMSGNFLEVLRNANLSFIAIDEAHCVSMWGHDFRPEYRQLGSLKKLFGNITIAAYTATATDNVREDIAQQLNLDNPQMLVGSFDRPNLIYKVRPREKIIEQVCSVLSRHENESGIIYCIRRKDVDSMCKELKKKGYNVAPYHAGMDASARKKNQDRFIRERVDIIVATVAFGMGIDKSNVRYVIHTGMPKSLEHYQQESGRAGRDGLEAECSLFYSGGDYGTWKSMMRDMPAEAYEIAMTQLGGMYNYCTSGSCRHQAILNYFDQALEGDSCNACDICLGEFEYIDDALIIAQKILSCIVRLDQRFGGGYVGLVLGGSKDKRILENRHDALSTYGLLADFPKHAVRDWIEQLTGQGYIEKYGEYNVLTVTEKGREVLKGQQTPRLLEPIVRKTKKGSKAAKGSKAVKVSKAVKGSWEGVDKELFEALRNLRSKIAAKERKPAYIVFGDASLRDMARKRPASFDDFLDVTGVGEKKCKKYGETFINAIIEYYS